MSSVLPEMDSKFTGTEWDNNYDFQSCMFTFISSLLHNSTDTLLVDSRAKLNSVITRCLTGVIFIQGQKSGASFEQ